MPALDVALLPWDDSGLALLRAMNTPGQKQHLGGPESPEKVADRHARYLTYHQPGEDEMLRIVVDGVVAGSAGYWAREEAGEMIYEIGWELIESFHGRGIGTAAATRLLQRLKPLARHDAVMAFPAPANAGSNGICRKLGFTLLGVADFEYPKGVFSPHNVWRLSLSGWSLPVS